jgi:hypothetical protein
VQSPRVIESARSNESGVGKESGTKIARTTATRTPTAYSVGFENYFKPKLTMTSLRTLKLAVADD